MKKKIISIIGGGIFGASIYILLKKNGFNCQLFEQNKKLLNGATSNNLNRIHFGYHYPRDSQTARQSYLGYKSFKKFYGDSIIKNFDNYYVIANESKISFKSYLKFCDKNNLKYRIIKRNNFLINKNIEGVIKINEPIYDWNILLKILKKKISLLNDNKIYLKTKINKIKKNNNSYILETKNKKYCTDFIIDASYHSSNTLLKSIQKNKKFIFQLVVVAEVFIKNFDRPHGIAVMDGPFFSFLPMGNTNKYLLYHVKHSVLKNKLDLEFNYNWLKKINKNKLDSFNKKVLYDIKKFFPTLDIKITKKYHLSPRVFIPQVENTDKRISKIDKIKKNYFKITSAKVDHSIDIANDLLKLIKKII